MLTLTRWETQTGGIVKTLWSDNGGEFDSKVFSDQLRHKGIFAECSLPYHNFQNGVAEMYNHTVADMGWSLLYNSSLVKEFWGYMFMWLAWTLNRIPNKTTRTITPLKCFHSTKPQLEKVSVFGSSEFVLVAPDKRQKLDARSIEGGVVCHLTTSTNPKV